ncbi:MAG: hypothetical protein BWY50_02143 [Spirochaetes bacterium ADurb.Bin315]|nr:MAG: hypothetical protein BWY50_02143 [Spirochaetes bacterium ADurb.Bin315]
MEARFHEPRAVAENLRQSVIGDRKQTLPGRDVFDVRDRLADRLLGQAHRIIELSVDLEEGKKAVILFAEGVIELFAADENDLDGQRWNLGTDDGVRQFALYRIPAFLRQASGIEIPLQRLPKSFFAEELGRIDDDESAAAFQERTGVVGEVSGFFFGIDRSKEVPHRRVAFNDHRPFSRSAVVDDEVA